MAALLPTVVLAHRSIISLRDVSRLFNTNAREERTASAHECVRPICFRVRSRAHQPQDGAEEGEAYAAENGTDPHELLSRPARGRNVRPGGASSLGMRGGEAWRGPSSWRGLSPRLARQGRASPSSTIASTGRLPISARSILERSKQDSLGRSSFVIRAARRRFVAIASSRSLRSRASSST